VIRRELSPADVDALEVWCAVRRTRGESASSLRRAVQRVRSFGRHCPHGLLEATRGDVFAFASSWARRRALPLREFIRCTTWQASVSSLKSFFGWAAERGLIDAHRNPLRGIRLPPRRNLATLIGPKDGPLYEALLANPRLDRRARSMLLLVAHGLTQKDIVNSRVEDLDFAAGVLVLQRGRSRWSVPLTDKAVGVLRGYLIEHFGSVGPVGWMFPARGRRQARPDVVRDVVRRAAWRTFPLPSQEAKRRRICAVGFRQLYLRRLLHTRIAPAFLPALARVDRLSTILRYAADISTPARARRELLRVAGRWSHWL
jgi:site-specific recombinase XerD